MQEAVKLISENGIWVFLIGILTSIIIGIVKTPIRSKCIDSKVDSTEKQKRENLFDTIVFLSTYAVAFIAAMVYYPLSTKTFIISEIFELSLPIWLSQSLAYGTWKKLGLKRALGLLAKLVFKDLNRDGEISLDEAISQVVKSVKEGKLGPEEIMSAVNENLPEVVKEVAEVAKDTEEGVKVEEFTKGGVLELAENIKTEAIEKAKEVANVVISKAVDGTEVSLGIDNKPIKF
jgi:hypothetical protein